MARIALLGGAGQIAWQLADWLQTRECYEVVALCRDSLLAGPHLALGRSVKVFRSDQEASIRASIGHADVVIDCSFAQRERLKDDESLRKLYNCILSAPNVKYFVHLSSIAVYGEMRKRSKVSFEKPKPDTVYGAQKLRTENLIRSLGKVHGKPCLILRLGHVYGPWMAWSSTWVDMIRSGLIDERRWSVPSNAVHIRRVCEGIAEAIRQEVSGTWNLIGSPNRTWAETIEWHRRALKMVCPEMSAKIERIAAEYPKRNTKSALRLMAGSARMSGGKILAALLDNPQMVNVIRLALARLPFMPSVKVLKDVFGSPAVEACFELRPVDPTKLIFDSIEIPGPNLPGASPLGGVEFNDYLESLRCLLLAERVQEFIRDQLKLSMRNIDEVRVEE